MLLPEFKQSCDELARLIQPKATPPWLPEYFLYWANQIGQDWSIRELQPVRTKTKAHLKKIIRASEELSERLSEVATCSFIGRTSGPGFDAELEQLRPALNSLLRRANLASRSSWLSTAAGKTKPGRGKTPVPNTIDPKAFCALVVGEAWRFFREKYPSGKNSKAVDAAMFYWKMLGLREKPSRAWGSNPRGAWRPYFEKAQQPELAEQRKECLRILRLMNQMPFARA